MTPLLPPYTLITLLLYPISPLLHHYYTLITYSTPLLHPYYALTAPLLHPYYTLILYSTLLLHLYDTLILQELVQRIQETQAHLPYTDAALSSTDSIHTEITSHLMRDLAEVNFIYTPLLYPYDIFYTLITPLLHLITPLLQVEASRISVVEDSTILLAYTLISYSTPLLPPY
jgi:hypothetical protein